MLLGARRWRNAMYFIMLVHCLCLLFIHYLVGDWSMRYHSVKSKRTPCPFHTEPLHVASFTASPKRQETNVSKNRPT